MGRKEYTEITNMCMLSDEKGRVLVQRRNDPNWGGITFPGGHVEEGESLTGAVIREVYEETGLNVSDLRLCGVKDWYEQDKGRRYLVLLYQAFNYQGELLEETEEGKVFWADLAALPREKMAGSFLETLKVFQDEGITEMFFEADNDWAVKFL